MRPTGPIRLDLRAHGHVVIHLPCEFPYFLRAGHNLAPEPRLPHLFPRRDKEEIRGLSPAVIDTITQAVLALTSLKRVGDLQALSVSESCLEFEPAYSNIILRSRPGYVPKLPTTSFRGQVVNLQATRKPSLVPVVSCAAPGLSTGFQTI